MKEYLAITIAGNHIGQIGSFFLILLAALIVGKIVKYVLHSSSERFLRRGHSVIGTLLGALEKSVFFFACTIGIDLGLLVLSIPEALHAFIDPTVPILYVVAIAHALYVAVDIVDVWLGNLSDRTESKMDDMLVPLVRKSARVTIVVLALLQMGTIVSDKPLTSVLAGLGVGGLAIALAAQETLKNFFGSLVILSDKPFELGERIVAGGHDGIVEELGFRSTRLRTLDGHLVTIPNGELANQFIQNIGKRPNIKKTMEVGVTYDTTPEKVNEAVAIIRELLDGHEGYNEEFPPRVYFSKFDAYALTISVFYWYHPADDWWAFMSFHETLCHKILARFNAAGIEFAFPTQTLFLASDPERSLVVGQK